MANRNIQKENTFTLIGAEYEAPASLNENIRAWFKRNSPHEPQLNMIPDNVRFSAVKKSDILLRGSESKEITYPHPAPSMAFTVVRLHRRELSIII